MNVRALAVKERPDLLTRPRGRRFGEQVSHEAAASSVHTGSEQQLAEYIEEHRDRLERIRDAHQEAAVREKASVH
eukprot:7417516-Karenia_brevis.AAC.1